MGVFLVEENAAGLEMGEVIEKGGLKALPACDVAFNNVTVCTLEKHKLIWSTRDLVFATTFFFFLQNVCASLRDLWKRENNRDFFRYLSRCIYTSEN